MISVFFKTLNRTFSQQTLCVSLELVKLNSRQSLLMLSITRAFPTVTCQRWSAVKRAFNISVWCSHALLLFTVKLIFCLFVTGI